MQLSAVLLSIFVALGVNTARTDLEAGSLLSVKSCGLCIHKPMVSKSRAGASPADGSLEAVRPAGPKPAANPNSKPWLATDAQEIQSPSSQVLGLAGPNCCYTGPGGPESAA